MFRTLAQRTATSARLSNTLSHLSPTNASSKMPLITSTGGKSRVILGLMTFGPPGTESKGARITTLDDYTKCLDYFQQQGYSEVDTARAYISGDQEAHTREAKWKDRGLTLATKCYPDKPGKHAADPLKGSLNKSLRELGSDTVDIFYLHAPDRSVPFEETLQACNDMFKEGKFVKLGLSNYAAWEVAEICTMCKERGWVVPTVYQAMYNAITRNIEDELIPCCRKYGLDLVIYNPVSGPSFLCSACNC
jgi:aflatoxin B1 aldehyde reductase